MTKKRLSDLLKEEVNKTELAGEAVPPLPAPDGTTETPAEAVPSAKDNGTHKMATGRRAATSRRSTTQRTPASKSTSQTTGRSTAAKSTTAKPSSARATGRSSGAKADLSDSPSEATPSAEATASAETSMSLSMAELEAALATTRAEKAALEEMVRGLQANLEAQQARLYELKDSLDKAEIKADTQTKALTKAETALEEARQTILKLTEANAQPSLPTKPPTRQSGVDILPRQPFQASPQKGYVRGIPSSPPVVSEQPNPMLSDADIGWVD
jgi:hypothetical protein